jgi:branched-chain amino acid transport system permease protein
MSTAVSTSGSTLTPQKVGGYLLILIAVIAMPFILQSVGGTAWVRIANLALLFVMLAVGLNIVVGFAGLLDLGYIAFYGVGAYVWALLASPQFNLHWAFWLILPLAALAAGMAGVVLGAPTLKLRGDYLAIVTLGFGEIVRILLTSPPRPLAHVTNGAQGIAQIDPLRICTSVFNCTPSNTLVDFGTTTRIGDFALNGPFKYYYLLLIFVGIIIVANLRLQNSRIGRAWEAIREDEIAARAMGINTTNMKLLAFAIGASFGGISGGMFASMQQFISPESFILLESVMVLAMVVLGGMGNIWGVVLGAIILTVMPELLRYGAKPVQEFFFGRVVIVEEVIRMLMFGLVLVLVMRFKPAGLFPSAVRKRELATADKGAVL